MPGLFSGLNDYPAPAWDLMITSQGSLIHEPTLDDRWRDVLGFGRVGEEWTLAQFPGLALTVPFDCASGVVPSFVGNEDEALKLLDGEHFGSDLAGLGPLMGDRVLNLLALWTLHHALNAHEARFSALRDELTGPPRWARSGERLRRLRRDVVPLAFDLETLGKASQDKVALADLLFPIQGSFVLSGNGSTEGNSVELGEAIYEHVVRRGVSIAAQGRAIAEALRTQGELFLAATNVRLQWLVLGLTLLVGMAGVYATLSA